MGESGGVYRWGKLGLEKVFGESAECGIIKEAARARRV